MKISEVSRLVYIRVGNVRGAEYPTFADRSG